MTDSNRLDVATLTWVHYAGILLALVTAAIHFWLGVQDITGAFGSSFLGATAGFLIGIAAVLVGYRRRLVYLLGIPFVGGQIVLWFAFNQPIPPISTIEIVDKVTQFLLIAVLFYLYRES